MKTPPKYLTYQNKSDKDLLIPIKILETPFVNWFISIYDIYVTDSGQASFNYTVEHVPKGVSDNDIDALKSELDSLVSDIFLDILTLSIEHDRNTNPKEPSEQ